MLIQEASQNQGIVNIIVALIALVGTSYGAIATYIAAKINAQKDREIAKLSRDKDIAVARLTGEKNTEIAKLQGATDTLVAQLTAQKDLAIAQMKVVQDLQIDYDKNLRSTRIEQYTQLWSKMLSLAKYPEPVELTYDETKKLAEDFRDWYFSGGGLVMSEKTREQYFNLQDGFKIVLQKKSAEWSLKSDELDDPRRLRSYLQRSGDWEPPRQLLKIVKATLNVKSSTVPEKIFENLRLLGSALRTSMTEDVQTRRESYLSDNTPRKP